MAVAVIAFGSLWPTLLATIDGFGQMRALVQGTVMIAATVDYPYFPSFLNQARGESSVDMRAVKSYDFARRRGRRRRTGRPALAQAWNPPST